MCHRMKIHIIRLLQWEVGRGSWIALGVARHHHILWSVQSFPSPWHCLSAAPPYPVLPSCPLLRAFPYPQPGDAGGRRSAPAICQSLTSADPTPPLHTPYISSTDHCLHLASISLNFLPQFYSSCTAVLKIMSERGQITHTWCAWFSHYVNLVSNMMWRKWPPLSWKVTASISK